MANAATDALSGTGTGASLGSVIPGVGTVVGGAAGGLIGLLGNLAGSGDEAAALQARQNVLNQLQGLKAPNLNVNFQGYKNVGNYNPALTKTFQQGPSAYNNIQLNPQVQQARLAALQSLQNVANNGGMTLQDRANLNNVISQTGAANAGAQGAIMQQMARRGMAGSGFQLAQQLQAQQAAANQASQQGLGIAGQAQQNALNAMVQGGGLANQYNSADWQQQAQAAAAQNAINQFNTQNSQNVANQNTYNQNQGQLYNLQNTQNIANQNTQLGNAQQLQNNQYQQQAYQDQLNNLNQQGGLASGQAGQYQQNYNNNSQMWGQVGQGAAQLGSGLQGWLGTPAKPKTDTSNPQFQAMADQAQNQIPTTPNSASDDEWQQAASAQGQS